MTLFSNILFLEIRIHPVSALQQQGKRFSGSGHQPGRGLQIGR
jgi:hypothetical protein